MNIIQQQIGAETLLLNQQRSQIVLLKPHAATAYTFLQEGKTLEESSRELPQAHPELTAVASQLTEEVGESLQEHGFFDFGCKSDEELKIWRRRMLAAAGIALPALVALAVPPPAYAASGCGAACTVGARTGQCFPPNTPQSTICACLGISAGATVSFSDPGALACVTAEQGTGVMSCTSTVFGIFYRCVAVV